MHAFFKTLFLFLVFSKGFYYLLNGNSILNRNTIRARVNNLSLFLKIAKFLTKRNQRTNGPVNAHLISWPSKAQNIQKIIEKQ